MAATPSPGPGIGVRYPVPPLACDCHMHVFGSPDRFPGAPGRSYTPVAAPLSGWLRSFGALGLQRLVVVQPSAYGADNACTAEAVEEAGRQAARGVGAMDAATPDVALRALHAAGLRGIRLNPKSAGWHDPAALRALIRSTAERIAPLGWHVQLYADLEQVVAVADAIRAVPAPVVLDHMGGARAGEDGSALHALLDLLAAGRCWVKLSGAYRVSRRADGFGDSTPVARALVGANPERLVWGSDWPHTASHAGRPSAAPEPIAFRDIDPAAMLELLAEAAGDEATFRRILVTNPAQLYGW